METKKILGYRKFNSKAGKALCIVTASSPYTDREIEHGACGVKVEELWLPEECHAMINPQVVGKNIELSYSVSNGRAYIVGAVIK